MSSAQGEDASNGKNSAPVRRIVRSTSDSTSVVGAACGGPADATATNSDDRSWRSAIGRSYSRGMKSDHRRMWALGDYHRFAAATAWPLGPVLVEACGISAGQRVLDVATGSGNVAIRAAKAGATVIASDLTPEHFAAGRRVAAAEGVELEWREADAEALPFHDGGFDVVTSCFGAMFAPDHRAVANELL